MFLWMELSGCFSESLSEENRKNSIREEFVKSAGPWIVNHHAING